MKRLFLIMIIALAMTLTSCTSVEYGHTGVKIIYGGETDMNQVYPEGLHNGFSWMWNSMKEYERREQTLTISIKMD